MPTGYTCNVQDGKVTELKDYAMQCARAFGACIDMRDDDSGAEIPDRFEPSTSYHDKAIASAKERLAKYLNYTHTEIEQMNLDSIIEADKRQADYEEKANKYRRNYESMLKKVREWIPPTSEHIEFKKFMIQQLQSSIDFDCIIYHDFYKPTHYTKESLIKSVQEDMDYHEKKRQEEINRTEERNSWIKNLRESLI